MTPEQQAAAVQHARFLRAQLEAAIAAAPLPVVAGKQGPNVDVVKATTIDSASQERSEKGTAALWTVEGAPASSAVSQKGLHGDLLVTQAANEAVDSLRATGNLPSHYVTKAQAVAQGWQPGKAIGNSVAGGQIGGDVFSNSPTLLPTAPGRIWFEADVGLKNTMSRSNQVGSRLLYSSDGLLFVTTDHYQSATEIGRWK
jgi:filamentous hemagglutinin